MTSLDAPLAVPIALTTMASQLAMTDRLLSGLFVRFPGLRVAFSESQIGWMPFLWERLDNLWCKHNYADDWSRLLSEPPSHYVPATSGVASSRTTSGCVPVTISASMS